MTVLVGHIVDSALASPNQGREPLWKQQLRGEMALLQPSIQELVWGWLMHQQSPHTSAAYGQDLREWLAFCNGRGFDPLAVTRGQGDTYGRLLQQVRGLGGRSTARKLAAISSWYTYLLEEDAIDANRFAGVRRPETNRKESSTVSLTESEARAMVHAAVHDHGRQKLRTAAIIPFMLSVGPRASEVGALTRASLGYEFDMQTVKIVGKGGKIRTRHIPEETMEVLDPYLARCDAARGPLFATASGGVFLRNELFDLVKRVARQAGLHRPERVTPHSLRHTFATLAMERGASLDDVADALGHESTDTTKIYVHARKRLENDPSSKVAKVLW